LLETRSSLQRRLDQLSERIGDSGSPRLHELQEQVEGYWESLNPIFDWTIQEKAQRSSRFLRQVVLPRSEAVVTLARELARINEQNLQSEQQRLQTAEQTSR
jgi:hypothetical protein